MSERRHGEIDMTIRVNSEDGSANTGKFLTEATRQLANRLTTLVMQNGGDYFVSFEVKILEAEK